MFHCVMKGEVEDLGGIHSSIMAHNVPAYYLGMISHINMEKTQNSKDICGYMGSITIVGLFCRF